MTQQHFRLLAVLCAVAKDAITKRTVSHAPSSIALAH